MNRAFSKIWIVITVVLIIAGWIFVWQQWVLEEEVDVSEEKNPEEMIVDETLDWQTYKNEEYRFEFEYPENAEIITEQVDFKGKTQINLEDNCYIVFGGVPVGLSDVEVLTEKDIVEVDEVKVERETYVFPGEEGFASIVLDYERDKIYPYFIIYHSIENYCLGIIDQILSTFKFLEYEEPPIEESIIKDWSCGEPITFTYKGSQVTYGTVESQGKCWMDRNLGVSRVATAYNDPEAYGDLFQWGRLDDGHQTRTSSYIRTLSDADIPGHSNFIGGSHTPSDWRSPQNNNLWQGVDGINNPCPDGWRIPTKSDWETEIQSWGEKNYKGAFASPLKLTMGGMRIDIAGVFLHVDRYGFYWSSTVQDEDAYCLYFASVFASMTSYGRAFGFSVRCLRN